MWCALRQFRPGPPSSGSALEDERDRADHHEARKAQLQLPLGQADRKFHAVGHRREAAGGKQETDRPIHIAGQFPLQNNVNSQGPSAGRLRE